MPDLAVHLAAATPLRRIFRDRPMRLLVLSGTVLPDLAYKGVAVALSGNPDFALVTHTPVGVVLLAYAASFIFEESQRGRAFLALLVGAALHIALDFTKGYLGAGVIPLAYPVDARPLELDWFRPEANLWLAPVTVTAALALDWLLERRAGGRLH